MRSLCMLSQSPGQADCTHSAQQAAEFAVALIQDVTVEIQCDDRVQVINRRFVLRKQSSQFFRKTRIAARKEMQD